MLFLLDWLILLIFYEYNTIIIDRNQSASAMPKNKVQFQKGLSLAQFLKELRLRAAV